MDDDEHPAAAVGRESARSDRVYGAAFGAVVLHLVGEGDDILAQLGPGEAAFWVAPVAAIELPVFVANGDSDSTILPRCSCLSTGLLPNAGLTICRDSAHRFL